MGLQWARGRDDRRRRQAGRQSCKSVPTRPAPATGRVGGDVQRLDACARHDCSDCNAPPQANVSAHAVYATAHDYLLVPTAKKPVAELDSNPLKTPGHPSPEEVHRAPLWQHRVWAGRRADGGGRSRSTREPGNAKLGEEDHRTEEGLTPEKERGMPQYTPDAQKAL